MITRYNNIALISIVALIIGFGVYYTKTHVILSKKQVKKYEVNAYNDSVTIATLNKELNIKDSLLFSYKQSSDVSVQQMREQQIVLDDLNKQLKSSKNEVKQLNDALSHYEENGLIRYFVLKNGLFMKGCYKEVFEKPTNICN